jgi:hypothetical protein
MVARRDGRDAGTDRFHDPRAFVAEDHRELQLAAAAPRGLVAVAHAGRDEPDRDLARAGRCEIHVLDDEGDALRAHHRRSHFTSPETKGVGGMHAADAAPPSLCRIDG